MPHGHIAPLIFHSARASLSLFFQQLYLMKRCSTSIKHRGRGRDREREGHGREQRKEVSLPLSSKPIRIFCLSQRVLAALKYLPDEWKIAIVCPARTRCPSRLRLLVSFWTTSIFLSRFLLFFLQSHQFSIMQTLPGCRSLFFVGFLQTSTTC